MIPQLNKYELKFPDASQANPDGILAWGGDLTPSRLILAYEYGIFPWFSSGDPILWWSPDPRLIMELDDFKISKSLKKSMKKFEYRFDSNFEEVMRRCSIVPRNDQTGTWISSDIIEAFTTLHGMGKAHSIESYKDGELVGGLYGIVVGKVFCGESMFAEVSDASKSAYAILVKHLKYWGYDFIDCQVPTEHLKSLGAKEVAREYFLDRLLKVNMDSVDNLWIINKDLTET
ncbi:MAG: leucyl/phenylalanyl-tRNA--protein transferase [Sulfurimonas sp.]|nr:leucyl/phenylalanyl-tRNA--protein transferase [Sulfurimonas sp.]